MLRSNSEFCKLRRLLKKKRLKAQNLNLNPINFLIERVKNETLVGLASLRIK